MPSRILLVDDEHDILDAAAMRLRSAGFETVAAASGAEGVQKASAENPDAIVLDVRMPDMDGLTVMSQLKGNRSTREIPVVVLSASVLDQGPALEGGARFFLRKPYQSVDLIQAVKAAIADTATNPTQGKTYENQENDTPRRRRPHLTHGTQSPLRPTRP